VYQVEEFQSQVGRRCVEGAVYGVTVIAVDAVVLVVKGVMKDFAAEGRAGEHPLYERFEFYVAVVEFHWNWAAELDLVRLESKARSVIFGALDVFCGVPVFLGPAIFAWLFRAC